MKASDVFAFENRRKIYIVGILGGIASGKTTIANEFVKYGAYIINADKIAHCALKKTHIQQKISTAFPQIIVNGESNRQELAKIVFSSKINLKKLEKIVHPEVRKDIKNEFEKIEGKAVVVLDAPLLWENGFYKSVDTLIFIDTPFETRCKRALENRGWNSNELTRREEFQEKLSIKKQHSDYIVTNENQTQMKKQIQNIWEKISL